VPNWQRSIRSLGHEARGQSQVAPLGGPFPGRVSSPTAFCRPPAAQTAAADAVAAIRQLAVLVAVAIALIPAPCPSPSGGLAAVIEA
jgi:hypothetical protein